MMLMSHNNNPSQDAALKSTYDNDIYCHHGNKLWQLNDKFVNDDNMAFTDLVSSLEYCVLAMVEYLRSKC